MFLIMGDTQFSSNPCRPVQIGPSFTLSLYMLFLGHSASKPVATEMAMTATSSTNEQIDGVDSRPYGIGSGERRPIWQEVLHKARVRICRTPRCWEFLHGRGFLPVNSRYLQYEFDDGGIVSNGRVQSDRQEEGHYAYYLEIIEDLDDGRVHETDPNVTTYDNMPLTSTQVALPIHQISKLFYTNSSRILNINADGNVENTSVLLLKRDTTDSAKFRPMGQSDSESEATSRECDMNKHLEQQDESNRQLPENCSSYNNPDGVHQTDCTRADLENSSWRFPPHLDPEWLAFEVFVEDSQDIEDSDSDEVTDKCSPSRSGGCEAPVGICQPRHASVDAHLMEQMRDMAISGSGTPVQHQMLTNDTNVNGAESVTTDHMKPRAAKSPFGPIVTSLSLLEMLLRLTSLQQFQQTSHLSIPDHVLTFFLEETATTGLQGKERWEAKCVAEQKIGFDPFTDSPIKANRGNQAM
ncbi:MAG: Ran-specific GTPase-activating protein 30 [Sporothrix epigloea]